MATMSILGMLNWNSKIFDNLKLPVNPATIDSDLYIEADNMSTDVLIDLIINECAELSLYLTNPDIFKKIMLSWNKAMLPSWQKLYNSYFLKYNPIWNKDGTIIRTETETRNISDSETETGEATGSGNSNDDRDVNVTRKVSAFNSTTFENAEMTDTSDNNDRTYSDKTNTSRNKNGNQQGTITRQYNDKEQGNIGVTMTQQLIAREREIYMNNVYDIIVQQFKEKFCILVY